MSDFNISIKKFIVHILDSNLEIPVLSDLEQEPSPEIVEFMEKHISKVLLDDAVKNARFLDEESQDIFKISCLLNEEKLFLDFSKELSQRMFDILKKNPHIEACDLIFCQFYIEEVPHFGIFKFNYKDSFIHFIENTDENRINYIVKQKTTIASPSQKVDECAIIDISTFDLKVLEKKYEIDGEKDYYFSKLFLNASSRPSIKEKVKTFEKASNKFKKEFLDEDITKSIKIKDAITQSIDDTGAIDIEYVAEKAFDKGSQLKEIFVDYVRESGVYEDSIEVSEKASKTFSKQKIKTDNGIEITLPTSDCSNSDIIEFMTNEDGTISMLIKNVKIIKS